MFKKRIYSSNKIFLHSYERRKIIIYLFLFVNVLLLHVGSTCLHVYLSVTLHVMWQTMNFFFSHACCMHLKNSKANRNLFWRNANVIIYMLYSYLVWIIYNALKSWDKSAKNEPLNNSNCQVVLYEVQHMQVIIHVWWKTRRNYKS